MEGDRLPTAGQSMGLSALFGICCVGVNRFYWGLIYLQGRVTPDQPFLLAQSFGLLIGITGFLLILIGRGYLHRICVRSVLTTIAAVLLIVVDIFIVAVPIQLYPAGFDRIVLVAVDCWLSLALSAAAERICKKGRQPRSA